MKNFPKQNDELFKSNKKISDVKIATGITKFFLFSESYKMAAQKLFKNIKKQGYESHFLIIPALFLCRHYLELRLKELISGVNYTKTENYTFPDGHNLEFLWNSYKSSLINADSSIIPNKNDLNNVEKLIKEFNTIDSSSMSFRYPVEKDKISDSLKKLNTFDIKNFINVMEKLFNFFYDQSGNLFHIIEQADEYFSYLRKQMISNYHI